MELVTGENYLFEIPLVDVNDDPLVVSTLSALKVEVIQYERIKAIYTLYPSPADDEVRVHPTTNTSLEFELTKELSSFLKKGELYLRIFMTMTSTDFTVDGEWLDIDVIKLADMV